MQKNIRQRKIIEKEEKKNKEIKKERKATNYKGES